LVFTEQKSLLSGGQRKLTAPDRRHLLGGGLVALTALGGGYHWWRGGQAAGAAQTDSQPQYILVLPFANLTGDPGLAWLADGMAEDIRATFSQLRALAVIGRVSSERFRAATDLADVARQLRVKAILTGNVHGSADGFRVSARLIDGSTGAERWSQPQDRFVGDVLTIEQDVVKAVAAALPISLNDMLDRMAVTGPRNPEAHTLFLKARALLGNADTPTSAREAGMALLDRAIALDHGNWAALALRASVFDARASLTTDAAVARKLFQHALADADTACAFAPWRADTSAMLAHQHFRNLEFGLALRDAEAGLALPFDASGLSSLAIAMGRFDPPRGAALGVHAVSLDPFAPAVLANCATNQILAGQWQSAIQSARRALALSDGTCGAYELASAHFLAGDAPAAAQALAKAPARATHDGLRAAISWRLGQRAESDAAVKRLEALDPYVGAYWLALALAGRGAHEQACAELEQGQAARGVDIGLMLTCPFLAPLQPLPRFQAVLARMFPADVIAAQTRRLAAKG
jgi:TolB-like protein